MSLIVLSFSLLLIVVCIVYVFIVVMQPSYHPQPPSYPFIHPANLLSLYKLQCQALGVVSQPK